MTVSIKEFLSSEDLFKVSDLRGLFKEMPDLKLQRLDQLFDESDRSLYLVLDGMVRVCSWCKGEEFVEDYFQAGELVNCKILLEDSPQQFAEVMSRESTVKKMPQFVARELVRSNESFQRALMSSIYTSWNRSQQRVYRVSALNSEQKVIHFLLEYIGRSGRRVGLEYVIKPVMTHEEMRAFAGVSRQTVCTVLSALRRKAILDFNRRYLIIRDLKKLKSYL